MCRDLEFLGPARTQAASSEVRRPHAPRVLPDVGGMTRRSGRSGRCTRSLHDRVRRRRRPQNRRARDARGPPGASARGRCHSRPTPARARHMCIHSHSAGASGAAGQGANSQFGPVRPTVEPSGQTLASRVHTCGSAAGGCADPSICPARGPPQPGAINRTRVAALARRDIGPRCTQMRSPAPDPTGVQTWRTLVSPTTRGNARTFVRRRSRRGSITATTDAARTPSWHRRDSRPTTRACPGARATGGARRPPADLAPTRLASQRPAFGAAAGSIVVRHPQVAACAFL